MAMGEFFDAMLRYAPLAGVISTFVAMCAAWSSSHSAEATRKAVKDGDRARKRAEIMKLAARAVLEQQRVEGRAQEVRNGWQTLSRRFGSRTWGTQNDDLNRYLSEQLGAMGRLVAEVSRFADNEEASAKMKAEELTLQEIKCASALESVVAMKEDLEREVSGIEKERIIAALETIQAIGNR